MGTFLGAWVSARGARAARQTKPQPQIQQLDYRVEVGRGSGKPNFFVIIDEVHRARVSAEKLGDVEADKLDYMLRDLPQTPPAGESAAPRRRRIGALRPQPRVRTDIPTWMLGLMAGEDAQRYAQEWGAHLHQMINEGKIREARRDRRRLAIAAITLTVALRVRRVLSRAR